jgi:hypothetical protein
MRRMIPIIIVGCLTFMLLQINATAFAGTTYNYGYDESKKVNFVITSSGSIIKYQLDRNGNTISKEIINSPTVVTERSIDLSSGSYDVYAYGVPEGAVNVQFPTWTKNNWQDDLEIPYIKGQKITEGIWKITIPFNKHNNETGTYYTDVYVDGVHFGGVAPTINPVVTTVTAPATVSLANESYDIVIDGVSSQTNQVLFPTWTEASGQDDLEIPWIQGTRVGEHKWKITIPFSKHNYEVGNYITHIYAQDYYGNKMVIGSNLTNAKQAVFAPPVINLSSGSYDVYAYGVPKGAVNVQFPTWTKNNWQDDLEIPYIKGQKITEGIWKITIPFNKHNNETGTYYTDVYVDGVHFGGVAPTINH